LSKLGFGGHKLSTKGSAEDCLREALDTAARRGHASLDGVSELEESVHAVDDFMLLFAGESSGINV
jgi:hypothetical protein